jgi:hypothetical protein
MARASVSKTEGRGFDSCHPCQAIYAYHIKPRAGVLCYHMVTYIGGCMSGTREPGSSIKREEFVPSVDPGILETDSEMSAN